MNATMKAAYAKREEKRDARLCGITGASEGKRQLVRRSADALALIGHEERRDAAADWARVEEIVASLPAHQASAVRAALAGASVAELRAALGCGYARVAEEMREIGRQLKARFYGADHAI